MDHDFDGSTLTDNQWRIMFTGPEWDKSTTDAMSHSLQAAYEIHFARAQADARKREEPGQ